MFYMLAAIQIGLEIAAVLVIKGFKLRLMTACVLILLLSFTIGLAFIELPFILAAAFSIVAVFRLFNLMRFGYGRMNPEYLKKSVFRSSWRLLIAQTVLFALAEGVYLDERSLFVLLLGLLFFAVVVFINTVRRLSPLEMAEVKRPQADGDMHVVSVCIPARNETEDLAECIRSVIASDYPKLEVLVYDDCSQDKSPEIIKQFAQAGVRFIQGEPPDKGWLAKNAAYQRLSEEALGDYVLFCGVDLRFEVTAISTMVGMMQARKLDMINIMPRRARGMRYALFFQSARYLWELALPRQLVHRQPALSSCWVVKKELLVKSAFKSVARSAMPERYFAWKADKRSSYSFISSRNLPLVYSQKTLPEQRLTALRLRYPQLRKRPENVLIYVLLALTVVFLPLTSLILFATGKVGWEYLIASLIIIVLFNATNGLITKVVSRKHAVLASLIFPAVVLVDLAALLVSMWRYEFGRIDWKGRNICLPIMHVVPRLPKI